MPNDEMYVSNCFGWEHFHLYLSGPIDFHRNYARSWREEWTDKLVEAGFTKQQIFNPCLKPLPKNAPFNLDNEGEICNKLRSEEHFDELCEKVSQIAHVDLRLVDKCDIVLVNMPQVGMERYDQAMEAMDCGIEILRKVEKKHPALQDAWDIKRVLHHIVDNAKSIVQESAEMRVPTYGTIHEIIVARWQRKPVYMVWEGGKKTCSGWMLWLVGHQNVFATFDELLSHLKSIAAGETSYNAKDWLLLDLEAK